MTAAYGDPKYWRECYAYWVCGSPNGIGLSRLMRRVYRPPELDS
jgi:peptide/nickel transport system substrate-binding protein